MRVPGRAPLQFLNEAARPARLKNGVEIARRPHGLTFDRVALTLASTIDKRGKESREPFECLVGRVLVAREEAR